MGTRVSSFDQLVIPPAAVFVTKLCVVLWCDCFDNYTDDEDEAHDHDEVHDQDHSCDDHDFWLCWRGAIVVTFSLLECRWLVCQSVAAVVVCESVCVPDEFCLPRLASS